MNFNPPKLEVHYPVYHITQFLNASFTIFLVDAMEVDGISWGLSHSVDGD